MPYAINSFGRWSGGMNEVAPPPLLRDDQCAALENMDYQDGLNVPQTRKATGFLAAFNDFPVGVGSIIPTSGSNSSAIMVITTDPLNIDGTEFWGASDLVTAFTSRGTIAGVSSGNWRFGEYDGLLIMACAASGTVAKKWTGSGNVANLGGSPPQMLDFAIFNNRLFAVNANDMTEIVYSALGDVEDYSDTDPVAGFGSFTVPSGGKIRAIYAHRERLIIFQDYSIWQLLTSLPNTDPAGWRLELLTTGGGCSDKPSIKTVMNDLLFWNQNFGVISLAAVEQFGDFEMAVVSNDVSLVKYDTVSASDSGGGAGGAGFEFANVVQNKYMITGRVTEWIYRLDLATRTPRWCKWKFKRNRGGVETYDLYSPCACDRVFYQGNEKMIYAFNNDGSGSFHVVYWPNDETDDDQFKDHYNGPDGTATFHTKVLSRGMDGGSLQEAKQVKDVGFSLRRLSTTTFNASGQTGETAKFALNIYFDESTSKRQTFNFSDSSTPTITEHHKRVRISKETPGARFHSLQAGIYTNEAGVGYMLKDMDATIDAVSRSYHDTLTQLAGPV